MSQVFRGNTSIVARETKKGEVPIEDNVMGPPKLAASQQRGPSGGKLTSRKPNLHLSLADPSQEPGSRFSAFSSVDGTPTTDYSRRGSLLARPSYKSSSPTSGSQAESSPSLSIAPNSTNDSPALDYGPTRGLGIGLPSSSLGSAPSQRALSDLSPFASAYDDSPIVTSKSTSQYNSNTASHQPHTPSMTPTRRRQLSDATQTPGKSPAGYDRAGQVGIGELSTPRWTTGAQNWDKSSSVQKNNPQSDQASPVIRSRQRLPPNLEARHARAISYSATAPDQGTGQSQAVLSPSRNANFVSSPSVPSFGPSLGGSSSLAALSHNFTSNDEKEEAVRYGKDLRLRENESPSYSIDAVSESEDDIMSSLIRASRNTLPKSPRIGDLAWSNEETGPFGVDSQQNEASGEAASGKTQKKSKNSFDINVAISDLLHQEEERSKTKHNLTPSSSSPDALLLKSSTFGDANAVTARRGQSPRMQPHVASSLPRRRHVADDITVKQDASTTLPRRSRQLSSPAASKLNGAGMAKLPSSSSAQSIRSRHTSSTSIAQSLLRGSLPLGVADDYEGRVSGGDDAAEALRKLDGISAPRTSKERDPSRSPRSSRQLSRPSSAGRRTPGNTSRASSPSTRTSLSKQRDEPTVRQAGSRRGSTSRSLPKGKVSEEGTSPSNSAVESPRRMSFSSPRAKRAPLPPLPSGSMPQAGIASPPISSIPLSNTPSTSTSKRASVASLASTGSANRVAGASRSKRTSDISLNDAQNPPNQTSLGFAHQDDPAAQRDNHIGNLEVPPVPPLPKAWESSRSSTNLVADSSASPNVSQSAFGARFRQPSGTSLKNSSASSPQIPKSPSAKWSFSNLSTAMSSKRSDERLAARKSLNTTDSPRGSNAPDTTGTPHLSDFSAVDNALSSANQSTLISPSAESGIPKTLDDSSKDLTVNDVTLSSPENSLSQSSLPTASPKSRRTPSFFRKRSSELSATDVPKPRRGKKSPSIRSQEGQAQVNDSPLTGSSVIDSPRQDTNTPSGRSSRKSILGLGSLLRSTSKKNIDSMPSTAIPLPTPRHPGTAVDPHDAKDTKSTPKASALSNVRRTSLIGRKRGRTLPSSVDFPQEAAEAVQLPPIQVAPLKEAPTSPRRSVPLASANESTVGKRRLTNSSSVGDLQAARDKHNAPSLPTIAASPSSAAAQRGTADDSSPTKRSIADNVPASRIPRATTLTQKRQTSLTSSHSSMQVRRLSGMGDSSIPFSKTSSSLASYLGISNNAEQSSQPGRLPHDMSQDVGGAMSLTSILSAYTNAKTPADVDSVINHARWAVQSANFSPRDKEVLVSLISRQEKKKPAFMDEPSVGTSVDSPQSTPSTKRSKDEKSSTSVTPSATTLSNIQNITTPSSTQPQRKIRASITGPPTSNKATSRDLIKSASHISSSSPSSRQSPSVSSEITVGRHSTDSFSPSPTTLVNTEQREGDEEIDAYIQRRHARKLAQGASLADLEKMLEFPEDEAPAKCYSYRQAEALWGDKLTDIELDEIRSYKEIYFVGQTANKSARLPTDGSPMHNSGYDDERGDYVVLNHDHLAYRYEVVGLLGRGSFGQVLRCKDHKTGKSVAIKLIRNKRRFHHQALVEVKILENLVKWDPNEESNVIHIRDSFYFRNHLCISMELLSINLYELIKANSFAGFSTKLIRRITSQVLLSLSLLRRNRVVHCDLKPENILLRHPRKSAIKVIDFGSSCFEHEKVYTYIQSRFYRSPEVILGMNYHTAIDIWSLGCILAELFSGYPLFPGENEQEQLACIMEILGVPDRYLIERSSRKKLFFDSTGAPRPVVNSKGKRRRPNTKSLSTALNCDDDLFVDFLAKCLHWDPERRIKPDTALRHPWIKRSVSRPEAALTGFTRRTSILGSSGSAPTNGNSSSNLARRSIAVTTGAGSGGTPSTAVAYGGTSKSSGTPSAKTSLASTPARVERRISLRSSTNPNQAATNDAVGVHTLRTSTRSQQPVQ